MKYKYLLFLYLIFSSVQLFAQTEFTVKLYDSQRERIVPIAVYEPKHINKKTSVVIFNHGYGQNANDSYLTYSCLTKPLAEKGYYVISIQHELPDDTPLAMIGEFMKTRISNWERGVENIMFTIEQFKRLKPELNWSNLSVIGHSNGGDMAMLLATEHPMMAQKVISLDHRRMIIPRCSSPKIYTLRGSDYEADENVIPTTEEQKEHCIEVVRLNGIKHGDMDNKGVPNQHKVILNNMNVFTTIETNRLILVEIQQKHLYDLYSLFGDSKVTEFYNVKTFQKPEDGQIYLDWFQKRFKEQAGIRWGIQLKGKDSIIGTIGYNNFIENHRANIGYDLQSAYWHKGYMTEAIKVVVEFGFNYLNINRIEAEVMTGNIHSEQLLLKIGFKHEGCLRDWMYWDNRHFDMEMYSLLRNE